MDQLKTLLSDKKCQKSPKFSSNYLQTGNQYYNPPPPNSDPPEKVHFHISAGNKLAEKYNLWMIGKPSVEIEISLSKTITQLFTKTIADFEIFELPEASKFTLRINGYDCLLFEGNGSKLQGGFFKMSDLGTRMPNLG